MTATLYCTRYLIGNCWLSAGVVFSWKLKELHVRCSIYWRCRSAVMSYWLPCCVRLIFDLEWTDVNIHAVVRGCGRQTATSLWFLRRCTMIRELESFCLFCAAASLWPSVATVHCGDLFLWHHCIRWLIIIHVWHSLFCLPGNCECHMCDHCF